ncbi:MAG: SPOR domain-containing protein [Silicimonas sp.]|jgi:cell division septation protein DedD|nr:SPOR domain-containing protein [Silicimonas sp.]
MTRVAVQAVFLSISMLALAACEEGINLGGASTGENAPAARATAGSGTAMRDVQRPDIFSTEEEALWDGRPSLGGIWVAHPDVTAPERAIITNKTTGQKIAGALFRRERSNPGPRIQLSSDAAAALNILAGQPTQVHIVAVRREEIEVEPAEPVISDEDVGEDATAEAGEAPETDADEKKPRGNFFQRIFGRKKPATEASAAAAASAASPSVETRTLDPVTTGAAAAIARAEEDDKPQPRPQRAAAETVETKPAPARSPDVQNPFVQVGLFSVEANAFSARDNLRQAGIVPTVIAGEKDGAPFWRVVVGPVTSADEQSEMLGQVKGLGFQDAFLTSN